MTLIVVDAESVPALASTDAFARRYGVVIEAVHRELARALATQTLEFQARIEAHPPWIGYFSVDADTATVVGSAGFKGDPGWLVPERAVEIAYATFPSYEGRGFGKAAALALVDIAAAEPDIDVVLAHTLPERNASGSILTAAGFRCEGEVIDPEDGPIWRWRRVLATA